MNILTGAVKNTDNTKNKVGQFTNLKGTYNYKKGDLNARAHQAEYIANGHKRPIFLLSNIGESTADLAYFLFVTSTPTLSQPNGLQLINWVSMTELWECYLLTDTRNWYMVYSTVLHYDSWATQLL